MMCSFGFAKRVQIVANGDAGTWFPGGSTLLVLSTLFSYLVGGSYQAYRWRCVLVALQYTDTTLEEADTLNRRVATRSTKADSFEVGWGYWRLGPAMGDPCVKPDCIQAGWNGVVYAHDRPPNSTSSIAGRMNSRCRPIFRLGSWPVRAQCSTVDFGTWRSSATSPAVITSAATSCLIC